MTKFSSIFRKETLKLARTAMLVTLACIFNMFANDGAHDNKNPAQVAYVTTQKVSICDSSGTVQKNKTIYFDDKVEILERTRDLYKVMLLNYGFYSQIMRNNRVKINSIVWVPGKSINPDKLEPNDILIRLDNDVPIFWTNDFNSVKRIVENYAKSKSGNHIEYSINDSQGKRSIQLDINLDVILNSPLLRAHNIQAVFTNRFEHEQEVKISMAFQEDQLYDIVFWFSRDIPIEMTKFGDITGNWGRICFTKYTLIELNSFDKYLLRMRYLRLWDFNTILDAVGSSVIWVYQKSF